MGLLARTLRPSGPTHGRPPCFVRLSPRDVVPMVPDLVNCILQRSGASPPHFLNLGALRTAGHLCAPLQPLTYMLSSVHLKNGGEKKGEESKKEMTTGGTSLAVLYSKH
jgi:hypothetical protein